MPGGRHLLESNASGTYVAKSSFGAWATFTPTWRGAASNPTIGNGTILGAYQKIEKLLIVRYSITMGSTTTYGSGTYGLDIPGGFTVSTAFPQVLTAFYQDPGVGSNSGVAATGPMSIYVANSTVMTLLVAGLGEVNPTNPFTFGTGDRIVVEGVLEVD